MMDFLVGFFSSDYAKVITGIFAIVAFIISLYNFFRTIITNHLSALVSIADISDPMNGVQQVFIDVVNKSSNNLVLLDVSIITNKTEYKADRRKKIYKTVQRKGTETVFYTMPLPILIRSQGFVSGCFEFHLNKQPPIPLSKVQIILKTSRGTVRKTIDLKKNQKYIY